MAKSFKKSDVVKSSDSCDDDHCQQCSFHGKTVLSERYCIDCEEYLCTKCSAHHTTQKLMRNHTLVSKKEANKSPHVVVKDKCSEKCTVHKDKTVKYFCKTHNVLGCSVCITMTHKQCDNIDYIPEVAADIKHNDDFKKFDEKLKAIEAACKAGISDVKKNLKVTETDHGQLNDAMKQFRKQVIGALDKLENELMTKAGSIMRAETKKLDDLSKKLSKHQADANAMIKQADTLLSSGKHCDTYVYTKNATKQLVSLDEELKRMTTGNTLQRYEFQPNMDTLKTIASGKLSCRAETAGKRKRAKVVFSYDPENDDELQLTVGDTVEILKQEEEGWWEGFLNGKQGMFPSNFVDILEEGETATTTTTATEAGDKPEECSSSYEYAKSVPAITSDRPMTQPHKQRTSDGSAGIRPGTLPMVQRIQPGTRVRHRNRAYIDDDGNIKCGRPGIVVGPVDADGRCEVRWDIGVTETLPVSCLQIV